MPYTGNEQVELKESIGGIKQAVLSPGDSKYSRKSAQTFIGFFK